MKLWLQLRNVIAVAAICALAAITFCAVEVALSVSSIESSTVAALAHVDATVTDLDRTVQIAGGAINEARKIERDNRGDLAAVNRKTLATLGHVDDLVVSFDASQKRAAMSIEESSAALVPVLDRAAQDLRELQPAIQQVTPLLQRTTDIAVNLSNATADVQHEIHKLIYPAPRKWYQKYFLDPLRTAAHLVTIPIR